MTTSSGSRRVLYPQFHNGNLHKISYNGISAKMVKLEEARNNYLQRDDKIEFQQRKLSFQNISASVANFRNKEERFHGVKS